MAAKQSTTLPDIHAQLSEIRCILLVISRSLAERGDPGDADEERQDVEDERVTLQHAIGILDKTMNELDGLIGSGDGAEGA